MSRAVKHPLAARRLGLLLALPLLFAPAWLQSAEPAKAVAKKAEGAGALKAGTSMGLVPADVSFHFALLRLREQFDWLLATKAFAKVKALPMVQEGWAKLQEDWKTKDDFKAARRFLQVKENQELAALVAEMASDEIFLTGGANVNEFVTLLGTVFGAVQFAPLSAMAEGHFDAESQNKARMQALLDALSEAAEEETLKVPDFVVGFRIKGKENAKAQLTRLENLLGFAVGMVPQLKGKLKRGPAAGGDFLTLTLDGALIPWSEIPFKEFEEDPGDYDDLVAYLKKMKVTVSLGIKGDYVLLAVGESQKFVASLGEGKSLAESDEVKPLWQHAGKKLSGVSYVSKAFAMLSAFDVKASQDGIQEMADAWLGFLDLPEDKQEKLVKDLKQMVADLEPFQTKPGASVACSMLTANGQESFSYDQSVYPTRDASKPLTLANHFGGAPIIGCVSRAKLGKESWANFAKWTKTGYGWFHELAVPKLPEEVQDKYKEIMEWAGPLFAKLEATTRTKLLPALAEGQGGFVLDAKLMSKQWFSQMPEAAQPVPAPELAILWGVSDGSLLKSALAEYRETTNAFLVKAVELGGGLVPDLQIPEPKSQGVAGGTAYFYPLPEQVEMIGLDKQLQPAAGLGEKVACVALSVKHVERLLKPTPLAWAKEFPVDLARPASSCFVFDHLALQDAAKPWLKYAIKQGLEMTHEMEKKQFETYAPQVLTIIDSLRIVRRHVSITYQENGLNVTHSFTEVRDID